MPGLKITVAQRAVNEEKEVETCNWKFMFSVFWTKYTGLSTNKIKPF